MLMSRHVTAEREHALGLIQLPIDGLSVLG